MSNFYLFISVLYFYLQLFYEFESLKWKNSEKRSFRILKSGYIWKILTMQFGKNNPNKGIFEKK